MDTLCFTKHFYHLILNIKQARLQHCIADLDAWYCFNGLRLNSSKSEAILLGTRQHLLSFSTVPSVNIASSLVTVTDQITTLGIIIDKRFIFVCLQSSRNLFSSSCPEALAFLSYRGHGCIQCKCSGSIPPWLLQLTPVLFDCSDSNIANLQHIQNIAAWIVLNTQRLCSSTCTGYLFISVFNIKYLL